MIAIADKDKDGFVSEEEFAEFISLSQVSQAWDLKIFKTTNNV